VVEGSGDHRLVLSAGRRIPGMAYVPRCEGLLGLQGEGRLSGHERHEGDAHVEKLRHFVCGVRRSPLSPCHTKHGDEHGKRFYLSLDRSSEHLSLQLQHSEVPVAILSLIESWRGEKCGENVGLKREEEGWGLDEVGRGDWSGEGQEQVGRPRDHGHVDAPEAQEARQGL